jgi:hypothetical protein
LFIRTTTNVSHVYLAQLFKHVETNYTMTRAAEYFVPERVAPHLDFVSGITRLPRLRRARLQQRDEATLEALRKRQQIGITPDFLRTRYNASNAFPKASNNRQAIAQFIGQYYDDLDLEEFFTIFYQSLIGTTPSKTIGPDNGFPGVESNLDVQSK